MRNSHWSVKVALIYLIFIFFVNLSISTWSTIKFSQLTKDFGKSSQESTMTQAAEKVIESLQKMIEKNNTNEMQSGAEDTDEYLKKTKRLEDTGKVALIYLLISVSAGIVTSIALCTPKFVMGFIEKFMDEPYIEYDSGDQFKKIMIVANVSLLGWDIYGKLSAFKYL